MRRMQFLDLAIKQDCLDVCLTDRYRDRAAFERARGKSEGRISFYPSPVDAPLVPEELKGLRTLFVTFQHFPPMVACAVLADPSCVLH